MVNLTKVGRAPAVEPLYPSAPDAALKDPELYEILALIDALRIGNARERKLARRRRPRHRRIIPVRSQGV